MNTTTPDTTDVNQIIQTRKDKLAALHAQENCAFPNTFKRSHFAHALHQQYDSYSKESLAEYHEQHPTQTFHVSGRVMLKRTMGKAAFITLQDQSGKIQAYLKKSMLSEGQYDHFNAYCDIGDIVGIEGYVFKTKTGELSIHATAFYILTKTTRPLPDKHHGLTDTETRYRQRYVDLIMSEESRKVFRIRSKMIQAMRTYFNDADFIEVETPMMQSIPGGAAARAFETHHNALNMPLFLRISPELYLKRLVVGGFERVYEINRSFRNEGLSTRHNPEFTMIEFYQAYATYEDMMTHTETLLRYLAETVLGTKTLHYQGQEIDLTQPFMRLRMQDTITDYNPMISPEHLYDFEYMKKYATDKLHLKIPNEAGLGKIWTEIFEATVEDHLKTPTFITAYPAEVSPLARKNDEDPFITDRFEFFIGGREIANGFSELNDPEDQAARFQAQVNAKNAGDAEAMHFDHDYIRALEYGLPPTAGQGIGIDRLVMIFTNQNSIRDVLLFPQMKPETDTETKIQKK